MNTNRTQATPNDDKPPEIDFSRGARGKFFRADVRLTLPVCLDGCAKVRGVEIARLVIVNELLRKDIELLETAR